VDGLLDRVKNTAKTAKSPLIMLTVVIVLSVLTISYYRDAPRTLIKDGMKYRREGKYQEAIQSFKGALSIDRKSSSLLTLLGEEYLFTGDATRGRFYFEKALACRDVDGKALYHLGALMAGQGDYQKVKKILKEGEQKAEDKAPCRLLRLLAAEMFPARQDCRLSEVEERSLTRELGAEDSLFIQVHLGLIAIYKGQFDAGGTIFKSLAEKRPDDSYFYAYQGIALLGEGKRDEALTLLLKAARMDDRNPVAYEYLGSLYLEETNYDDAAKALEKARKLRPGSPGAYYFLGLLSLKKGKFHEASVLLGESLARQPNSGQAHRMLAEAYEKLRMHSKAREERAEGSVLDGPLVISAPPY